MSDAGMKPPSTESHDSSSSRTHESLAEPLNVPTPRPSSPRPPNARAAQPVALVHVPSAAGTRAASPIGRPTALASDASASRSDDDKSEQPAKAAPVPPAPAPAPKGPAIPESIVFHKSPDRDDFGIKAFFEGATHPMTYHYFRSALRTAAFVTLPLFTVAVHPHTMFKMRFPQMVIAAVISSSTHRGTLGEQIGLHTWTWRGITYQLILGTIADSVSVEKHIGAWYGYVACSIFIASLSSHSGIRRFLLLYIFVYMMMMRMVDLYFGVVPENSAAWFSVDHFTGSALGTAALLFPYPVMTSKLVDKIIAKLFAGMGKMVMAMQMFAISPDVHAANAFFQDYTPFEKIEGGLVIMPALLWFANWEPTEFALRNPVRQLKLAFLRRILALAYAVFNCGQLLTRMRRRLEQLRSAERIKDDLRAQVGGAAHHRPGTDSDDDSFSHVEVEKQEATDREGVKALRKNTQDLFKASTMVLAQCITLTGSTKHTPEAFVKNVPCELLEEKHTAAQRAGRMELIQVLCLQREQVLRHSAEAWRKRGKERPAAHKAGCLHPRQRGISESSFGDELATPRVYSPSRSDVHSPFGHRTEVALARNHTFLSPYDEHGELVICYDPNWKHHLTQAEYRTVSEYADVVTELDAIILLEQIVFHMLIGMIANEMDSFRELMETYKPPKSLFYRLMDYFVVESWQDFWEALWDQLTFATPTQVRVIKDGIKLTSAYLAATALNLEMWTVPNGIYFFGVTALLGLPVEEETLGLCVCRMAGNTIGCAAGYLVVHNTHNLSQQIGAMLCFAFVFRLVQNHQIYGQCFFYAGVITLAGTLTAVVTMELVTRLIASIYTLGAYTIVCSVVFPTNPRKVLWNYRMKFTKVMSEIVDDIALAARAPLVCSTRTDDKNNASPLSGAEVVAIEVDPLGYPVIHRADALCSQLSRQTRLLKRMLGMCTKWTPFAAAAKQIRGVSLFPAGASGLVHHCQTRLSAEIQLFVFGVQLLHRPRSEPPQPMIERLLSGPVAEFLENFAGAIRLLSQDFIDSLQKPHDFSYPVYLSHVGFLSRMRVRLRMITFESYVFLNEHYGGGSAQKMSGEGYSTIRDEVLQRAATEGSISTTDPQKHPKPDGAAAEHGGPLAASGSDKTSDSEPVDALPHTMTNVSFTDRFLLTHQSFARTPRDSVGGPLSADTPLSRASSVLSVNPAGVGSMALPPRRAYRFRAALEEEHGMPSGAFPQAPEEPEDSVGQQLHSERSKVFAEAMQRHMQHKQMLEESQKHDAADSDTPGGSKDSYEAKTPVKERSALQRAVSNLVQAPEPSALTRFPPPYQGPGFSYQEDTLETAGDTDFRALVLILGSCSGIISEMTRMAGAISTISNDQKEQHDSSLVHPLLDQLSDLYHRRKQSVHARYHYPPPPPQKRSELNMQNDIFGKWGF